MDTQVRDLTHRSDRGRVFLSPDWNRTVYLKQTFMLFLWRLSGATGQDSRRESLVFSLDMNDCRCPVSRSELSPPRSYLLTIDVLVH